MIKKDGILRIADRGRGCKEFGLYQEEAHQMVSKWDDLTIPECYEFPLVMDENACVNYNGKTEDITQYAFNQMCARLGVPAAYMQKCYDAGKPELALENLNNWRRDAEPKPLFLRSYEGTVRGILSNRYETFDNDRILDCMDTVMKMPEYSGRYELNSFFMNPDRVHMRFVNFNEPVYTDSGSKLYSGMTISSSSVGSQAFQIKYFLYRFACHNGVVIAQKTGVLHRQNHSHEFEPHYYEQIAAQLEKIDILNEECSGRLLAADQKKLSESQMESLLNSVRQNLHLGRENSAEMNLLRKTLEEKYPERTKLSVIHAITENAQRFTLDTRMEHEEYAGRLLMAA